MKVKDIMSKNPTVVHPQTPINEIEKIFNRTKFWSVYVGERNDFVGIITRNDLHNRADSYSLSTPAYKIMSEGVVSIDENADVEDAQRILSAKRINGIAVTRNGKHVGIVTRYDIKTKTKKANSNKITKMVICVCIGAIILGIFTGFPHNPTSTPQSTSQYVQNVPSPIITSLPPQKTVQRATITSIPTEKLRVVQTYTNSESRSAPSINIAALEKRVHELINQQRNYQGLSSLSFDSSLAVIAKGHSQDMARNNYFAHENLQGLSPTDRGNQQGYPCRKDYGSYYTYGLAENIYQNNLYDSVTYYNGIPSYDWNTEQEIAQSTVDGWMNSAGHRKNILTSSFDREGIGVAIATNDKVYITQDFC
jgi:uncharacterized protein YkwD